ncbi:class II fructose-bisphosphate aldolase [Brachyspira aalborgi]|uniref:Class II fructose-bisphosphate aldolase n=1 Tax=Brachyspira aalborgi TaxID=29522 RepID=A0A5C8GJ33_9SPIR|nr:class II fructose-bisphosphate aldolase [Brachyspira aalborgi]TXJ61754.1 class II fructose-bisphosphate aldolase [Brachyspira aalborgi]
MLVTLNDLFKNINKNKVKAYGAFNLHCYEMILPFFQASKEINIPIIMQISTGTAQYIGYKLLADSVKSLSETSGMDICLHLDHCSKEESIKEAIDSGFSSVMIDGSALPIEDNIKLTKRVVEFAHSVGVSVEGEIGTIGGNEDGIKANIDASMYTEPKDALRFYKETLIDAMAISIGTAHGLYKGKANISFEKLKEIKELTNAPLVLHGGTGVSNEDIKKCVEYGINKVNVGTELNATWIEKAKETFQNGKFSDSLRNLLIPANNSVKEVLLDKIKLISL